MKEKIKKIIKDIIDVVGYGSAFGTAVTLTDLSYRVLKNKIVYLAEPNLSLLLSEIGMGLFTIIFLVYKLANDIKKRHNK